MKIKPLKTEADYNAALEGVERLFDAEPGTPEGDRLEVLATLVEVYEERRRVIPLPDPIEAIQYHFESRGLKQDALHPFIGNKAAVETVLNRRAALTIDMIRRLHDGLGISADILIQPYLLAKSAA